MCGGSGAVEVQAEDGEEIVGGECADEEALMAFAVVDELAADGAMHLLLLARRRGRGSAWRGDLR